MLEVYSDTAEYKGDATFLIRPGWADQTKVSFQSYSQPGSYIRHYNYVLQLDTVTASSSATLKSDATFARTDF